MTWMETTAALVQITGSDAEMILGFADLLLKSGLIVLLARYLELDSSPFFTSVQARLLWLLTLFILVFLPLSTFLFSSFTGIGQSDSRLALVVFGLTDSSATPDRELSTGAAWNNVLLCSYFVVLAIQLLRLLCSVLEVRRLRSCTDFDLPGEIEQRFQALCRASGVQRQVSLGISSRLRSPATFGVIHPVV